MSSLPDPQYLEFNRPGSASRPYANVYRFGDASQPGPLVFYVGGQITSRVYEERRHTQPLDLAREFDRARASLEISRVDAVFCPCPVHTEGLGAEEWILRHHDEVVTRLGAKPTALACVGYSAGAGYATLLALNEEAAALSVYGPAGVDRTLESQRPLLEAWAREGRQPFSIDFFVNEDDPVERDPDWLAHVPPSLHITRRQGQGDHGFKHYLANGSVFGAFRFALMKLTGGSHGR